MKNSISIQQIKEELNFLKNKWVIVFGSWLNNYYIPERSDIDVAILSRNQNREYNLQFWADIIGNAPSNYDLRVFEILPLTLQMNIITHYQVIYGDPLEISEYLYQYRKIWSYTHFRVEENKIKTIDEKKRGIKNRLNLLKL